MDGSKQMVLLGLTLCLLAAFVNSKPLKGRKDDGPPKPREPPPSQGFWSRLKGTPPSQGPPRAKGLPNPPGSTYSQETPSVYDGNQHVPIVQLPQSEIDYNGLVHGLQYLDNPLDPSWTDNYMEMAQKGKQLGKPGF